MRFAIALHRAGEVRDINIDYLNNKDSVYDNIIKYFPPEVNIDIEYPFPGVGVGIEDFPLELDIDKKSLIPFPIFEENITCQEPVSKLYNLSLEKVIENINPHKRARYS
ncbi:hypothetical protein [Wolbachia endosymbiont (group B) of Gerris lacustris]|uniref:hypothetical protein n=1 Tax=Wolbachia endosymbiont (group B) of Gerris lacustris TaxID=3066159 RepID=UPI00333F7710